MAALPYNTTPLKRNPLGIQQVDAALTAPVANKAFNAAAAPPDLYQNHLVTTNAQGGMSAGPAAVYSNALQGNPQPGDQAFRVSTGPAPAARIGFGASVINQANQAAFDAQNQQTNAALAPPQPGAVPAPGRPEDAINPGAGARPVAQGIAAQQAAANNNLQAMQNGIESGAIAPRGVGSRGIAQVDAALTGYNPNFPIQGGGTMAAAPGTQSLGALPGTGSMGPLPGTVSGGALPGTERLGALPGTVQQGALPGATDRNLQLGTLDRILGYNPETASRAEALLGDATQNNLSSSLALARSARGGPAAVAQAMRGAQAEGAATMSQSARDLAALRAQEEDTAKGRELSALGLGNEAATGIRASDVGERGQNVEASTAALNAGVAQRGQTVTAQSAELQALAQQRGQTVESLMNELNAATTQRGQTIGAQETERNAGVSERGQTIEGQVANLNAGVNQRGQTIEQQVAERNAGVSERGQTLDAQEAQKRAELDAILGRSGLAQSERNASVTERGQTLDATMQAEQIKTARDTIAASSLTDAEKIASTELLGKVQAGYMPTQAEKIELMRLADKLGEPSLFQSVMGGLQAIGTLGAAGAMIFSDIRAKTDIEPGNALETLKNAPAYDYNYKPGMGPPGRQTGPMAQDLESTVAGRSVVHDTPDGKAIDPNRLALVNASAIGELGNKLDAVLTGGAPKDVAGRYGTPGYARDLAQGQADASGSQVAKFGKAASMLGGMGKSPADAAREKRKKMDDLLRVAGL